MKAAVLFAALLCCPAVALAGNFATCLLDRLPGVKVQQVAAAAVRSCQAEYPAGAQGVEWGSGKGWFARYKSRDDCLADKARDTSLPFAVSYMQNACNWLYGDPPVKPKPWELNWAQGAAAPPPKQ